MLAATPVDYYAFNKSVVAKSNEDLYPLAHFHTVMSHGDSDGGTRDSTPSV
jgi:hypothetical protein